MKTPLSLMFALVTTTALAEPSPVPNPPGPGVRMGWLSSGSYCAPSHRAQHAIPKSASGNCP